MSQKEANQINKAFQRMVIGSAVLLAIGALIFNPSHLVTAAIVFAAGLEGKIAKADEFDLRK